MFNIDLEDRTLLALGTLGTIILVFFSIPEAINRWSPILNSLPTTLLNWIQNLLLATLAFSMGWFTRRVYRTTTTLEVEDKDAIDTQPSIDTIVGCVQVDESFWRGEAEISDKTVESVDMSSKPRCPDCKKELHRESYELPTGQGKSPVRGSNSITRKKWECYDDNCDYTTDREAEQRREAGQLYKGFVQKIVESTGEDYSLDNLIERISGEVTPQKIWEEYAETVENSHISTNCFH